MTGWENNDQAGAVVDGDLFGEVLFWSAQGSYDPDRLPISAPPDAERSLFIDLGGSYFLDNIRVLTALQPPGPFRAYRIQLSDGSTNAGGELAWKTVGSLSDIVWGQNYHDFKFPLTKVKHFAFTYRLTHYSEFEPGQGSHGLSELQFFGEGFLAESQISSEFGGESPFIELAETPQNLASIEWEADVPPGTNLILQTRTGDTVERTTRYYKKNGDEYPGTEEEARAAWKSDSTFFGGVVVFHPLDLRVGQQGVRRDPHRGARRRRHDAATGECRRDGAGSRTYTAESEGFEVVMETDSLWVRLPAAIKTTSGSALVELQFEATIFVYNTFFIGSLGHSEFENSWQRADDGDANGVVDSETTVVLALERGELLGDLQVDSGFTPNGDGINDELEVSFSLMRVLASTPVQVEVYDLSGRLVARITEETITAGRHTVAWTGVDQSGAIVPPGIYLMRIDLDVHSTSKKNTSVHRLVHVAY